MVATIDGTNHGNDRSGRNPALLLGACPLCQKGSTPQWQQRAPAATTAAHSLQLTISDGARAVFAAVVWPSADAGGCPDLARTSHPRSSWNCHIAAACVQYRRIGGTPALERAVQPARSNQSPWLGIEHLDCRLPPLHAPEPMKQESITVALIPVTGLIMLVGLGASTAYLIPWSLLPDAIDADPTHPAGLYTAWMVFGQKFIIGLSMSVFGTLLSLTGYISTKTVRWRLEFCPTA